MVINPIKGETVYFFAGTAHNLIPMKGIISYINTSTSIVGITWEEPGKSYRNTEVVFRTVSELHKFAAQKYNKEIEQLEHAKAVLCNKVLKLKYVK